MPKKCIKFRKHKKNTGYGFGKSLSYLERINRDHRHRRGQCEPHHKGNFGFQKAVRVIGAFFHNEAKMHPNTTWIQ